MIERKIIQGLITSSEYLKKIRPIWDSLLLESSTAALMSKWCIEHFDKYSTAPGKEIETIFFKQLKNGLDKDIAEEIEEDILPDLSEEYEQEGLDINYLFQESIEYLQSRKLQQLSQQIQNIIDNGQGSITDRIKQAEEIRNNFKPLSFKEDNHIDFSKKSSRKKIRQAFNKSHNYVIHWPKQLGHFWNDAFIEGGFIILLAPEKRFKTYWLLEFAMFALKQGKKVAFFQAGDMNEDAQIKRIGEYLCRRSIKEKYCKEHYRAVRDCKRNQFDECNKKERECNFGVFEDMEYEGISIQNTKNLKKEHLIEAYESNLDYRPCSNCEDYDSTILKLGVPWLEKVSEVEPLNASDAVKAADDFFIKKKRQFKLSTHPSNTLSVNDIINTLDSWEDEDDFIADLILIDYLEILSVSKHMEERQRQNQISINLRRLSQTKRQDKLPLVIAPTQADSGAYEVDILKLKNYSEDKRKYAHVTAMYGLNLDPKGREKEIGIMRINEMIKREGDFNNNNQITILQDLNQGRPFLGSFY